MQQDEGVDLFLSDLPVPSDLPYVAVERELARAGGMSIRPQPNKLRQGIAEVLKDVRNLHAAGHGWVNAGGYSSTIANVNLNGQSLELSAEHLKPAPRRDRGFALLNFCHGNSGSLGRFGTYSSVAQAFHRLGFRVVISATGQILDNDAYLVATRVHQLSTSGHPCEEWDIGKVLGAPTNGEVERLLDGLRSSSRPELAAGFDTLWRANLLGSSLQEYIVWQ